MIGQAESAREEGGYAKRQGAGEWRFSPSRWPGPEAALTAPPPGSASSRETQELWDANGPLGMLNGAFWPPQRGKMRRERNFSFEVSFGEDQTMGA